MSDFMLRHTDWYTAEDYRKASDTEESLARLADADGDASYVNMHRAKAAQYREMARLKEVNA